MQRQQIPEINAAITKTRKAIIALGCSFVQGHGAIAEEVYQNYNWKMPPNETMVMWDHLPDSDKNKIVEEYTDVRLVNGHLDFLFHEYNNAFVSVLCNKYFDGEYAAINLGRSGCGNRATIKELYYYPDINWAMLEEIIVIYCPSGLERFDFITDLYHTPNDHGRWESMWPNELPRSGKSRKTLWDGYRNHLYSEKFEILEQISNIQELILWCKYKNAKLIIVPGFSRAYKRSNFVKQINRNIARNNTGEITRNELVDSISKETYQVADMWPWDNMYEPDGCPTFVDLVMKQEFPDWENAMNFYGYAGQGSPQQWITPCAHPSAKGHDLFAKYLYEELTTNPLQYNLSQQIGNL